MPESRKLHDRYFKLAKAEGYVARSAYKLIENQREEAADPAGRPRAGPGLRARLVAPGG